MQLQWNAYEQLQKDISTRTDQVNQLKPGDDVIESLDAAVQKDRAYEFVVEMLKTVEEVYQQR